MSPDGRTLSRLLGRAVTRVRTETALAVALAVATVLPAALLGAWVVGGWGLSGPGPLILWVAATLAGAGVLMVSWRRWLAHLDEATVVAAAERRGGMPEGSLRGVLELGRELPRGVSPSLFQRAEAEMAQRIGGTASAELTGDLGQAARRRWQRLLALAAVLFVAAGTAGFAAPERARAAWTPLLSPVAHLNGPRLPGLVVTPGNTAVPRGASLGVEVEARLRDRVTLHWRAPGDVPRERVLRVEAGRAVGRIGPVDSEVTYRVSAPDGAVSGTFVIAPIDPLMVTELVLDVRYPAHVRRPPDRYRGEPPLLRVPAGTRLALTGRTSRPVAAVAVRHESGAAREATLEGATFRVGWTATASSSGRWEWSIEAPTGGPVAPPAPLDVRVVEDAAPRVRITHPGTDTVMPVSKLQTIVAEATDDHGLASAALRYRLVSEDRRGDHGDRGDGGAWIRVDLPVTERADRAGIRGVLDASGQALVRGDRIEYHVEVRDNGPNGQTGRSDTHVLRVPGGVELREGARREGAELVESAERLASRARALESEARDLRRTVAAESGQLGFEAASQGRALTAGHDAVRAELAELRSRLAALGQALEEAGLSRPELERRLDEVEEQYGRAEPADLGERTDALRDALSGLDRDATEAALQRLAAGQAELRQRLERSLDAARRAVAEQELSALSREADELAARQDALAETMTATRQPPDRQRAIQDGAERLGASLAELQEQLLRLDDAEGSAAAGWARKKGRESIRSMQESAAAMEGQRTAAAAQSARRAADQLAESARALGEGRWERAESRRMEGMEALGRAALEAVWLAERQESLRREMDEVRTSTGIDYAEVRDLRADQVAIQQGVRQLEHSLTTVAQRSPLVDRSVWAALEGAGAGVDRTLEAMGGSRGLAPGAVGRATESVERLNGLAVTLLANRGRMEAGEQAAGEQAAMQELADVAEEQGSLNSRADALRAVEPGQDALSRILERMAREQRELARRIGDVGRELEGADAQGELDPLSAEAEQIAGAMEAGRLDREVRARQEQLFRRLLDAGRGLERDEPGEERVGAAAVAAPTRSPAALDPAALEPAVRYPLPSAEQLNALPPAYRRLVLEYFDRLNRPAGGIDP